MSKIVPGTDVGSDIPCAQALCEITGWKESHVTTYPLTEWSSTLSLSFAWAIKRALIARTRTFWDPAVRAPEMDITPSACSCVIQCSKVLETIFTTSILLERASWKEVVWIICREVEFNNAMRTSCRGKWMTIHFFTPSLTSLALTSHLWD